MAEQILFVFIVILMAWVGISAVKDLFGSSAAGILPERPAPPPGIRETPEPMPRHPGGYIRGDQAGYSDADILNFLKAYEAGRRAAETDRSRPDRREPDRRYDNREPGRISAYDRERRPFREEY